MIYAYVTSRGVNRGNGADILRHAVDTVAHLSGAADAVCGKQGAVYIGPWDPDDPRNCRKCLTVLKEMEVVT